MKENNETKEMSVHWADIVADKIIREKGDKPQYTCASGITPSGTVHIGNFREMISVDLVVRALRHKGRKVRFIYSWDDYDVFRKVPANMPQQEMLKENLRKPIVSTPDPFGCHESYARHHERDVEDILPIVGIQPEFIYQASEYQKSVYAEQMKIALEKKEVIRGILDEFRAEPLPPDWWPISVFCNRCLHDETTIEGWDGNYNVSYSCSHCGNKETVDLRHTGAVKLFWRVDWPMRWKKEGVDFEPAGKDHHSAGGSFDTAKKVVKDVYGAEPPITFKYDFISIKGRGGKISSSSGEVISVPDALEIYQPEIVRYLFASTRPDTELAISFDLDVIKIYEDYDRTERIYYGVEPIAEKKRAKEVRSYELSQVKEDLTAIPKEMPYQTGFRHLCNLLQINDGDINKVKQYLKEEAHRADKSLGDEGLWLKRLDIRAKCAWNWVEKFAPEDFRFRLRPENAEALAVSQAESNLIKSLEKEITAHFSEYTEITLSETIYKLAQEHNTEPKDLFKLVYRVLIGKEMGPRLAGFILNIGQERVLKRLQNIHLAA